jgi:hypothetical protein
MEHGSLERPVHPRVAFSRRRIFALLSVALVAVVGGFSLMCPGSPGSPTGPVRLYEKGRYQYVVGRERQSLLLLHDSNGDRRADAVVAFEANRPSRGELDTNGDGAVDRWEHYSTENGRLERIALARTRPGVPDQWLWLDAQGRVERTAEDADGDGQPDSD